jgi:GMP synthase-like glutamine amidotransferase
MTVQLVLTERRVDLTESRARNYERLRARLAAASGLAIEDVHYEELEPEQLARADAIVLSGSSAPWSAHEPAELARLGEAVRAAGRPVLGICAGLQLQALFAGGEIGPSVAEQRGFQPVTLRDRSDLFRDLPDAIVVFEDHTDEVTVLPASFRVLASSDACAVQAIADPARRWWGTQFHPEEFSIEHPAGERVLRTFFELVS